MNLDDFAVAVWHPFGPHGRESPEEIIERKRREIAANGWTFWSFQHRRPETLAAWQRELAAVRCPVVLCSNSEGAVDPADSSESSATDCRSYRPVGEERWQPWPDGVRVPHPFKGKQRTASAFIVGEIIHPVQVPDLPAAEWLSDGIWRQDRVPTRGEYLIRPGGAVPLRPIRALLVLRSPYLAVVSADTAMTE